MSIGYVEGGIVGIFDRLRSVFGKVPVELPNEELGLEVEATAPAERRLRQRRNARAGTRVLIIDDSPTIVAVLRKMLRTVGCVTLEALDAEKGIELARTERPDLIFLDIILPGMNGFAALRALRRNPLTVRIPVIMMSGNEQATEQFFGSRIGVDDFMKKPFSRAEVFARIERLLDVELIPRRIAHPAEGNASEAMERV
jgi:CheY-like chemotaxis protein